MWTKPKAQAILEVAIFGSILIMLVGAIVNYGLRYNFEQKIMMDTFRKALKETKNEDINYEELGGQSSLIQIQDRHIPNPAQPFAVGTVSPFSYSSSITRSFKLHESAEWKEDESPQVNELPRSNIEIQGKTFSYKVAAFRKEAMKCGSLKRYKEVYGSTNVFEYDCEKAPVDEDTGEELDPPNKDASIKIIDSCEGEIINYDACKRQCRMITEPSFCEEECNRGKRPSEEKNCESICNKTMTTPWYCKDDASGNPVLDNIFSFAIARNKPKAMGVQPDYTKRTIMDDNSIKKVESPGPRGGITSTDTINWSDTTSRSIVYNDHLNADGTAREEPTSEDLTSIRSVPVESKATEVATCTDGDCGDNDTIVYK